MNATHLKGKLVRITVTKAKVGKRGVQEPHPVVGIGNLDPVKIHKKAMKSTLVSQVGEHIVKTTELARLAAKVRKGKQRAVHLRNIIGMTWVHSPL